MKRTSEWVLALSLSFLVVALIAFLNSFFVDATILALYGGSGLFFILSPHRIKNARWNTFKIVSYLMFICGTAVSLFKYLSLEANPI
jgi:hypothetical protein